MDKNGEFIPICSKNTFMKYYSDDLYRPNFWTDKDGKDYIKAIQATISNFFN